MELFEIKHSWTGNILFSVETASLLLALEAAVKAGADLTGADLTGAHLRGARLTDADLRGARLTDADLRGAHLTDAHLRGADLTPIRDDFWAVLSGAPAEVPGLRQALVDGRIDGSTYHGPCACLIGTLAHVRGVSHDALPLIRPNSSRPIERWFLNIKRGDNPETSVVAQQTLAWLDTWLDTIRSAFAHEEKR